MSQTIDTVFKYARNNTFDKCTSNIFGLQVDLTKTKIDAIDDYGNSLLHIAAEHSNEKYVEILLDNGYDWNQQNKFKKTPWDIAVREQNSNVLSKFIAYRISQAVDVVNERVLLLGDENKLLVREKAELRSDIESIKLENKKLSVMVTNLGTEKTNEIMMLTRSKSSLNAEVISLKRKYDDISADNMVLRSTNKRLRENNEELADSNKKLKTSVDALITASMK
jgi:FtsZ-binding cell division protein ZapB